MSGHEHTATATVGFSSNEQWEINLASVTDWPMEFARVRYWLSTSTPDRVVRLLNYNRKVPATSSTGRRAK